MSDLKVGMRVKPKIGGLYRADPEGEYEYGIVASLHPTWILVSPDGNMSWKKLNKSDFEPFSSDEEDCREVYANEDELVLSLEHLDFLRHTERDRVSALQGLLNEIYNIISEASDTEIDCHEKSIETLKRIIEEADRQKKNKEHCTYYQEILNDVANLIDGKGIFYGDADHPTRDVQNSIKSLMVEKTMLKNQITELNNIISNEFTMVGCHRDAVDALRSLITEEKGQRQDKESAEKAFEKEKKLRIYFQNICNEVANLLDDKSMSSGQAIVYGNPASPTKEIQDAVRALKKKTSELKNEIANKEQEIQDLHEEVNRLTDENNRLKDKLQESLERKQEAEKYIEDTGVKLRNMTQLEEYTRKLIQRMREDDLQTSDIVEVSGLMAYYGHKERLDLNQNHNKSVCRPQWHFDFNSGEPISEVVDSLAEQKPDGHTRSPDGLQVKIVEFESGYDHISLKNTRTGEEVTQPTNGRATALFRFENGTREDDFLVTLRGANRKPKYKFFDPSGKRNFGHSAVGRHFFITDVKSSLDNVVFLNNQTGEISTYDLPLNSGEGYVVASTAFNHSMTKRADPIFVRMYEDGVLQEERGPFPL